MEFFFDPNASRATMENIALIGGAGYIGSALNIYLKQRGYKTVVYDYKTDKMGIQDYDMSFHSYDAAVYLGDLIGGDINNSIIDNVIAPITAMEAAGENNVRFIYLSSLDARNPNLSFYAMSKCMAEVQAARLNEWNADIRVLRLANVYGGREYLNRKNSVIAKFAKQKMKKQQFVLDGDGSQVRDFIHLYDVIDAIERAIVAEWQTIPEKEALAEPFDIGTGRGISIVSLARMFSHDFTFNADAKIKIPTKVANITRAKDFLSFRPKRMLSDYLKGI